MLGICCTLYSYGASCAENIGGRLQFYPPIQGNVVAYINVIPHGETNPFMVIAVNSYSPYEFSGSVDESFESVILDFVVENPNGYIPRIQRYVKKKKIRFQQNVLIRRKPDLYVELLNVAKQRTTKSEGERDFKYLIDTLAETPAQKLEAYQIYARWVEALPNIEATNKAESQVKILQAAFNSGVVAEVGSSKKFVYWQERLDAFLKLTKYTSLSMPVQDFGIAIANNSSHLQQWTKFVSDYNTSGITIDLPTSTASTEAKVSAQLDALRDQLKHSK